MAAEFRKQRSLFKHGDSLLYLRVLRRLHDGHYADATQYQYFGGLHRDSTAGELHCHVQRRAADRHRGLLCCDNVHRPEWRCWRDSICNFCGRSCGCGQTNRSYSHSGFLSAMFETPRHIELEFQRAIEKLLSSRLDIPPGSTIGRSCSAPPT
jgi:hypothetical protein